MTSLSPPYLTSLVFQSIHIAWKDWERLPSNPKMNDLFGAIYHFEKPRKAVDSPLRERHSWKPKWSRINILFWINFLRDKEITLPLASSRRESEYIVGKRIGSFSFLPQCIYHSLIQNLKSILFFF